MDRRLTDDPRLSLTSSTGLDIGVLRRWLQCMIFILRPIYWFRRSHRHLTPSSGSDRALKHGHRRLDLYHPIPFSYQKGRPGKTGSNLMASPPQMSAPTYRCPGTDRADIPMTSPDGPHRVCVARLPISHFPTSTRGPRVCSVWSTTMDPLLTFSSADRCKQNVKPSSYLEVRHHGL